MHRSASFAARMGLSGPSGPPRPLLALMCIVAVCGLSWALLVPPFQAPDEPAHFAYVQSLAESFRLTGQPGGLGLSSDIGLAQTDVGGLREAGYPNPVPPDWSRSDQAAYLAIERGPQRQSATNGSGFTSATGNPPFYYLVAGLPYLADHGGTAFGRLIAVRLGGVLLLLLTTLGAWLLAGEVFGTRRSAQLACASVAVLVPMTTFVSSMVTPDGMLITTWTWALYLGARVINRALQPVDGLALGALVALAVLTKATSYALVGPAAVALLLGAWRRPVDHRRAAVWPLIGAGAVALVPILGWIVLAPSVGGVSVTHAGTSIAHPFHLGNFINYMWQFYLPRLPFAATVNISPGVPAWQVWGRELVGDFGWLDVPEPSWLYSVGRILAPLLLVVTVVLLARVRGRRRLALLVFFSLVLLALLVLLHYVGYISLINGSGVFLQGRYLLPAISLLGLAIGLVLRRLPSRLEGAGLAVLLTALLVWQVISLSTIVQTYYL